MDSKAPSGLGMLGFAGRKWKVQTVTLCLCGSATTTRGAGTRPVCVPAQGRQASRLSQPLPPPKLRGCFWASTSQGRSKHCQATLSVATEAHRPEQSLRAPHGAWLHQHQRGLQPRAKTKILGRTNWLRKCNLRKQGMKYQVLL